MAEPFIQVHDLVKTFDTPAGPLNVLRGISLDIQKGEFATIVGPSGSGKTTLFLNIDGLLDGEGHIEVMGVVRSARTITRIRSMVGFLFSQVEHQFIMTDLLNDVILSLGDDASGAEDKKKRDGGAVSFLFGQISWRVWQQSTRCSTPLCLRSD